MSHSSTLSWLCAWAFFGSEEYMELSRRVKELPLAAVEAAAGWSIRHMGDIRGGMEIAIGMLAIRSEDPEKLIKALHLSLASVETLRFLNSSLDVAHVFEFLGRATPADLAKLRMREKLLALFK